MIQEMVDKIKIIQQNMKVTQQKMYVDRRRKSLELAEGDKVFLKVPIVKGIRRFNVTGKLSPRFDGPYHVIEESNPLLIA